MNIYDEKRRNSVEAYCGVQLISPTERCIQLEDQLTAQAGETLELKISLRLAVSRETEANRNWSTEARKWLCERTRLREENERLKQMVSDINHSHSDDLNESRATIERLRADGERVEWYLGQINAMRFSSRAVWDARMALDDTARVGEEQNAGD